MTGYTRQSAIDNGTTGDANELTAEYNQIEAAMSAADGHSHNGSIGEGARISTISSPDASNTLTMTNTTIDLVGDVTADNDVTALGTVQGTTLNATGNVTVGGLVDGRDVAADGIVLDAIEASATAEQTDLEMKTA